MNMAGILLSDYPLQYKATVKMVVSEVLFESRPMRVYLGRSFETATDVAFG